MTTTANLRRSWQNRLAELETEIEHLQEKGLQAEAFNRACQYDQLRQCLSDLESTPPPRPFGWTDYAATLRQSA